MIYLMSDLHGGDDISGFEEYIATARDEDTLIILGDTELNFRDTDKNREFSEYFMSVKKNIAIVDGNHENHPYLRSFPEDVKYGAPVYRLTDSIVCLKRGEIYTIEGKSFFAMGGCKSSPKWYDWGLAYEGEDPDEAEVSYAIENLKAHGNTVDYVLTHKYKKECKDPLGRLTDYIDSQVTFKHWYAGHWHKEERLDDKHTTVFERAVSLAT